MAKYNPKFVKRNYLYFVYQILKTESTEAGKHFTAEELVDRIQKDYGVSPDRKTIYTLISDLQNLGFDVHQKKDLPNRGYYLDKRKVEADDFFLIADGINSLNGVDIDWKQTILGNLSDALGYDYMNFPLYEYDFNRPDLTDGNGGAFTTNIEGAGQDIRQKLFIITKAILEKKKLILKGSCLENALISEAGEKFKQFLNSKESCLVNPYQIFRNTAGVPSLFFYMVCLKKTYCFACSVFELSMLEESDMKREKPNDNIYAINLNDFKSAYDYRQKQKEENTKLPIQFTISFGIHEDSELFQMMMFYVTDYHYVITDGVTYVRGKYRIKDEKQIIDLAITYAKDLIICPGNEIYDGLSYLSSSLSHHYLKEKEQRYDK